MAAPASFLGRSGLAAEGGESGMAAGGGPRMAPGPGFDISKLAPKLKGDKRWVLLGLGEGLRALPHASSWVARDH